jgi:hypothetical protein
MEKPRQNVLPLKSASDAVNSQINGCLAICALLQEYLLPGGRPSPFGGEPTAKVEAPRLVKESAELTFIHACNRLDSILNDPTRWDHDPRNFVERAGRDIVESEVLLRRVQAAAIAQNTRPCIQLRPLLSQVGKVWLCVYGDVIGSGNTPEEAMASFDEAYRLGVKSEPEPEPAQDVFVEEPKPVTKKTRKRKK